MYILICNCKNKHYPYIISSDFPPYCRQIFFPMDSQFHHQACAQWNQSQIPPFSKLMCWWPLRKIQQTMQGLFLRASQLGWVLYSSFLQIMSWVLCKCPVQQSTTSSTDRRSTAGRWEWALACPCRSHCGWGLQHQPPGIQTSLASITHAIVIN